MHSLLYSQGPLQGAFGTTSFYWGRSKHGFEGACLTCTGQSLEIPMGSVVSVLAHFTVLSPPTSCCTQMPLVEALCVRVQE